MLFPTTIVGSFPQPDWLIDREHLAGRPAPTGPPRSDIGFSYAAIIHERPTGYSFLPE